MIYKLKEENSPMQMEIRKESEFYEHETLEIKVICGDEDDSHMIRITKKDVYHLIGALHLLHKEMK
jgi:hypothetical protein